MVLINKICRYQREQNLLFSHLNIYTTGVILYMPYSRRHLRNWSRIIALLLKMHNYFLRIPLWNLITSSLLATGLRGNKFSWRSTMKFFKAINSLPCVPQTSHIEELQAKTVHTHCSWVSCVTQKSRIVNLKL